MSKGRKKRESISFAISVAVHAWVLVGFGIVWIYDARPEPKVVEIVLLKQSTESAPLKGSSLAVVDKRELADLPAEMELQRTKVTDTQSAPNTKAADIDEALDRTSEKIPDRAKQAVADSAVDKVLEDSDECRPTVEYKLSIARPEKQESTWLSATRKHSVAELANWEPAIKLAPAPVVQVVASASDATSKNQRSQLQATMGGSTLSRLEIIQARIDAITPLVHRTSANCRSSSGILRVRFRMNEQGYPIGHQIVGSDGAPCLTPEVDTVLHLAEPYPYVSDWISIRVKFAS